MNSYENCLQGKIPLSQVNKKKCSWCQYVANMKFVTVWISSFLSYACSGFPLFHQFLRSFIVIYMYKEDI